MTAMHIKKQLILNSTRWRMWGNISKLLEKEFSVLWKQKPWAASHWKLIEGDSASTDDGSRLTSTRYFQAAAVLSGSQKGK